MEVATWAAKCLVVGGCSVSAAVYTRYSVRSASPGLPRLLLALPIIVMFVLAPLAFSRHTELLSRASTAAILLWLANFKVLLLVLGRGPLVDPELRLDQFVALMLWPVLHVEGEDGRPKRLGPGGQAGAAWQLAKSRAVWRLPQNLAVAVVGAVTLTHPAVPLFVKTYSAAFGVCCYCDVWANAAAALIMACNGLQVAPSWDRPWLQNCLSDFWARRWNLPAAYSLRSLVYEPIMEGRAVRKATPSAASPPTAAAAAAEGEGGASPPLADQQPSEAQGAGGAAELLDVQRVGGSAAQPLFKATVTRMGPSMEPAGDASREAAEQLGGMQGKEGSQSSVTMSCVAPSVQQAVACAEHKAEASLAAAASPPATENGLRHRPWAPIAASSTDTAPLAPSPTPSTNLPPALAAAAEAAAQAAAQGSASAPSSSSPEAKAAGGRPRRRVSAGQRLLAAAATFAVSGLMHEVLLLVCTGWEAYRPWAGVQMLYFMLQVPVSLLEQRLSRGLKRAKVLIPDAIAIPVTSLTLQVPGLYLFWKPIWNAASTALHAAA